MPEFVVIAEHPPQLCPTSNDQIRKIFMEGAHAIPDLAEQLSIKIIALRVFGPDHVIVAVVESGDIDAIRTFALQSHLMQWNTVKIHATFSLDEAVALVEQAEVIF